MVLVEKEIKNIYIAEYAYLTAAQLWNLNSVQSAEDELNTHPSWYYDFFVGNWTIESGDNYFIVRPGERPGYIPLYTWYFEYNTTTQTWSSSEIA